MSSNAGKFTFGLRDLVYAVTFVCVVFGLSVRSGDQFPIVFFNGFILALIAFVRGAWLYKWIFVGACATHAVWVFVYAASYSKASLIEKSDLLNLSVIALTLGALVGAVMGLGPRRETSTLIVLGLFTMIVCNSVWFLLPDVQ
jgi:hypothetical protein